jgi:NhaP-type Na+/H+ or K+/H+ antiporter
LLPIDERVRTLGISSVIAFVALNAGVGLALFLSSGGENQTSAEMQTSKLMVAVGCLLFALAAAALIGVVKKRRVWAVGAYATQIAFSLLVFLYALSQSDHADGKLTVVAMGIELTGLAGVTFAFRPTRRRADR